jgi:hypothetical protein
MSVRLRALVPLLVLTGVDYALWNWSIADGHDIVSLVAGLTLLPLAAVTVGGLALTGARLFGLLLGKSGSRARPSDHTHLASGSETATTAQAAQLESSSRRLAA